MDTKICTSIEQSKKLIELGIDINTADMCYPRDAFASSYDEEPRCHSCGGIGLALPSWSLVALLELLPNDCSLNKEDGKFIAVYLINDECGQYDSSDALEATYNLVVYLLEQGWIKTQ